MSVTERESASGIEQQTNSVRPMTGDEYIESLRDGREVYVYGERVKDVTTHPAFRNSVRSVAKMYDALHDPATKDVMTVPTDTGNGGFTHPYFRTSRSSEDLLAAQGAIAQWQRLVYGWLGRAPDYKGAFLSTLDVNSDFYGEYAGNAKTWYRTAQERCIYLNHAIVHPPVDRSKPADQTADVCVHVIEENDNGIVVSGAKVVATGSAITNANFVAHYGLPLKDKRFGLSFTAPMDTPGMKLLARTSYELSAAVMGSPFDMPLSSRFDENDSILVFDRALVPWENIFLYDAEAANNWVLGSGFVPRFTFHGCTRLAVKLDFIAGCALKALRVKGTLDGVSAQTAIGEVLNWRDMFWAISDAMAKSCEPWVGGAVQPNMAYGLAYRTFMGVGYPRIKQLLEEQLGSALIYLNSHAKDWGNDDIRPYLDQYVRGSEGVEAMDRVKAMKLLWDALGTEFGSRHELYERNYGGDVEAVRWQTTGFHTATGTTARLEAFAEQCMADYDVNGWTPESGYISNDDVSFHAG